MRRKNPPATPPAPGVARPADDGRSRRPAEQRGLRRVLSEQVAMQAPMPAALVGERETIAAFLRWVLLWIEALVDHDAPIVEENCSKDVGIEARTRHAEQLVGVVELDAELEVLLNNVFDGDRRRDDDAARGRAIINC